MKLSLTTVSTLAFVPFGLSFAPNGGKISSTSMKARLISSFEPDDFAMKTGEWPYTEADMGRLDPTNDSFFYD